MKKLIEKVLFYFVTIWAVILAAILVAGVYLAITKFFWNYALGD